MAVASAGPYASLHLTPDSASTSPLSFLQAYTSVEQKTGNYVFYPTEPFLMMLDDQHTNILNFYHATLC